MFFVIQRLTDQAFSSSYGQIDDLVARFAQNPVALHFGLGAGLSPDLLGFLPRILSGLLTLFLTTLSGFFEGFLAFGLRLTQQFIAVAFGVFARLFGGACIFQPLCDPFGPLIQQLGDARPGRHIQDEKHEAEVQQLEQKETQIDT